MTDISDRVTAHKQDSQAPDMLQQLKDQLHRAREGLPGHTGTLGLALQEGSSGRVLRIPVCSVNFDTGNGDWNLLKLSYYDNSGVCVNFVSEIMLLTLSNLHKQTT